MSSRRESGVRGRGPGVRSSGKRFAAVWLLALAASLTLGDLCRAGDSAAERRSRIEALEPAERKQRQRDHEWFMGLEKAERDRLRQLHAQLENAPELRPVMHAYCRWLKSLSSNVRTELLDLEPAKRIERIKELRKTQKDMEGLRKWIDQYVQEHEAQLLEATSEQRRPRLEKLSPEIRRRTLAFTVWWRLLPPMRGRKSYPGSPRGFTDGDLENLRSHLPDATRKELQTKPSQEQWQAIAELARDAVRRRFSSRRFRDGWLPPELQKRVDESFETLTKEEQDRLLSMPPDEMQERLRSMYFFGLSSPGGPMGRWPGPRRGGGTGPPGASRDRSGRSGRGPRGGPPREDGHPRDP